MSTELFQQIVDATRGEYVLHAPLGQSDVLGSAFLAREVATGRTVLLVVPPDAESLDVVGALSDTVPADAGGCAACGFRIGTWIEACPRCDHALLPPPGPGPDANVLRDQLRGTLDVVGSLPHVRGGTMYFGHDAVDGRLTAFVVRPQPDGQLGMDVVWEAGPAVGAGAQSPFLAASAPPAAPPSVDESEQSAIAPEHPSPVYAASGYEAPTPADAGAPAPRRRWWPIGLGVGVIAATAAVAVALTHRGSPPPVRRDSLAAVPPTVVTPPATLPTRPDTPATTAAGGTSVLVLTNDSIQLARRQYRDSVRAARRATVTIDGDLPAGWTHTINGARPSGDRDVRLTAGVPALIRIEAPGYCADTLQVTPAPSSHQHWSPTLRGRPVVGEC